jgi:hypothetical protein
LQDTQLPIIIYKLVISCVFVITELVEVNARTRVEEEIETKDIPHQLSIDLWVPTATLLPPSIEYYCLLFSENIILLKPIISYN